MIRHQRAGFSAIEMLIVVVIGGVLLSMVVPAIGRQQARRGAVNARDSMYWLAARAQSLAIARGENVSLEVDPANDSAWVSMSGNTVEVVRYTGEFQAGLSMTSNTGLVRVCYTPRGFAAQSCNVGTLPDTVKFTRGPETARILIRPLGQVERL